MTKNSNPTPNEEMVKVTAHNYVRAESDLQMKGYIESYGQLWEVPPQPAALRR